MSRRRAAAAEPRTFPTPAHMTTGVLPETPDCSDIIRQLTERRIECPACGVPLKGCRAWESHIGAFIGFACTGCPSLYRMRDDDPLATEGVS